MASISGHIKFSGGVLQRGMHIFANSNVGRFNGDAFVQPGQDEFKIGPVPRGIYSIEFNSTEIEPLTLHDVQIPSDKKLKSKLKYGARLICAVFVVRADEQKPVTLFRIQVTKIRTLNGAELRRGFELARIQR